MNQYRSDRLSIRHCNSLQLLDELSGLLDDERFVDYIFTSTPYPGDRGFHIKTMDQYMDWFDQNVAPWFDVIKLTGSFSMVFTSYRKEGDFDVDHMTLPKLICDTYGLIPINVHIWAKTNAEPKGSHRFDRHAWEIIPTFGMSPSFILNRQREPYKEKTINKAKSGNMRQGNVVGTSSNGHSNLHPDGATLSNIITGPAGDGRRGTPRVKGGSFPAYLPERFIQQFTNPGAIVIDPFCGRGTTPVEAERLYRFGIGCDSSQEAFDTAIKYTEFMRNIYEQDTPPTRN